MGCVVLACRESEASDGAMAGPSGNEAARVQRKRRARAAEVSASAGDEASDTDSDAMAGPSGKEAARLKVQRKRRKTQKVLQADFESDLESDPDLSLEVQRARRAKRQRTDAEADGPYWSTSGTSSDAPGAPPGPEFTQWDGADPLATPEGRDAEAERYHTLRDEHHARMQKHIDSLSKACAVCHERWICKGPFHPTVQPGKYTCSICYGAKGKLATHFKPKLYQQMYVEDRPLSRGEKLVVAPILALHSFTVLTARRGAENYPLTKKFKLRCLCALLDTLEHQTVTVPRLVGDVGAHILAIKGLTDDENRKAAGYTIERAVTQRFLRRQHRDNKVWLEAKDDGFLKWDAAAFEAIPDGVLPIPVVTEAAAGGIGRNVGPGDEPGAHLEGDHGEDEGHLLSCEELVEAVANAKDDTIAVSFILCWFLHGGGGDGGG